MTFLLFFYEEKWTSFDLRLYQVCQGWGKFIMIKLFNRTAKLHHIGNSENTLTIHQRRKIH